MSPRLRGMLYIAYSIVVWAGWVILSSYGVHSNLTAYDITALRFGTAGAIFLPVLMKKGLRIGPWGIWGGLFLALMMGAPYNTVAVLGMKYASVAQASIIQTVMLVLTTIGGIFLLHEKTSPLRILGIGVSIGGVLCLLQANAGAPKPGEALGHLLFIVGGAMWAVYIVTAKKWKIDPLHAAAAVCVYSALFYLPLYFWLTPSHIGLATWKASLTQAVFQGILNSVFALVMFNRAIVLLGASTASAFLPLIPVIATLAAMPLLGETPVPLEWIGIAVATGGVLLSTGMIGRWLGKKEVVVA